MSNSDTNMLLGGETNFLHSGHSVHQRRPGYCSERMKYRDELSDR
jgi:hypothetical protein